MLKCFRKKGNDFWRVYCISFIVMLVGCQFSDPGGGKSAQNYLQEINNSTVTVDFGPDGRLWRLIPTPDSVYIDYSENNGHTYSQPIRVNKKAQKINVWPENPPAVVVSKSGRIHVLYYADETQKSTTFFSFSDDNGQTFSEPVLISDHAHSDKHYMDKMLVDENNKVYLFWHDMRHEKHNETLGSGVLSLYFTTTDKSGTEEFINRKVSDGICSCCRTATDFSPDKLPVVLARMVFKDGARDHALIKMEENGTWSELHRITQDDWRVDACPEHGPALSIDRHGRSHLTWFTLGDKRQGIFYAHSDDYGLSLSRPMQLGNTGKLPSHPDVLAVEDRIVLAWKEFDGNKASIVVKQSDDRGESWQLEKPVLFSTSKSGHPSLISNGEKIYLSWVSRDKSHQFIEVK